MLRSLFRKRTDLAALFGSSLFNESTFYKSFERDLLSSCHEVIIESPFITGNRVASLLPIFRKMRSRGIKITLNTRHPAEHEPPFDFNASRSIQQLQALGIEVLFTGGHHRKLAIIDRRVLWEGSLNILSQNSSCEVMRRIDSRTLAQQMIDFIRIDKFVG